MIFSEFVGHNQNIERLTFAANNDLLPSAYLFVGIDGIGKSTLVREFAQRVNCREQEICHRCENCRSFDLGSHPDFLIIKPSGKDIRIGQIHELINRLSIKPTYAAKRIVLVKHTHQLNQEAANSFLKILEEPPLDTLIILMTSDESLLLETLVSRCQKMMFAPLTRNQLQTIINRNNQLQATEIEFILNYSRNRIRKELIDKVSTLINLRDQTIHLLQNPIAEKIGDYFYLLDKWAKQNLHFYFLEFCTTIVRDLLSLMNGEDEELVNLDAVIQLRRGASLLNKQQLQWIFSLAIETELCIKANASKSLALESFLVQLKQIYEGVPVI